MIYVVVNTEEGFKTMFVKAEIEEDVALHLRLSDTQRIVGRITDNEITVLQSSKFAVITG